MLLVVGAYQDLGFVADDLAAECAGDGQFLRSDGTTVGMAHFQVRGHLYHPRFFGSNPQGHRRWISSDYGALGVPDCHRVGDGFEDGLQLL